MRDPRLAEIDFLIAVEQRGKFEVRTRFADNSIHFGLDVARFRDMVIDLLLSARLAGGQLRGEHGSLSEARLREERDQLIVKLGAGHAVELFLTHAGRIHLWNLRDFLLRDAELEPFGLKNKAAWERDLVLRLRFATADEPLSIIFLDLDNFGQVNKRLGVSLGDDVLRASFGLIKNFVGSRGAVYRFGGEEVGVLLPNVGAADALAIAEELRGIIETEVLRRVPALGAAQTASIGVGTLSANVESREALDQVDAAVREAKLAGKNRVVVARHAR